MKQIGIWIDKREAKIVEADKNVTKLTVIKSAVEDFNPKGGSGTRFKGGPQDVVQDSKYLEREQHQLASYFDDIANHLSEAKEIVIFGPAQTGMKLNEALAEKHTKIHSKVKAVKKADNMTDNQLKAWVREFYTK